MTSPGPRIGSTDRVMVLAPHPDDETLSVGGLLHHAVSVGAAVRIVYLTAGENNPWAQRAVEGRWRIGAEDRARWAARRKSESLAALRCLGILPDSVVRHDLGDQRVTDRLLFGSMDPVSMIANEISQWKPSFLLAPSALDAHPDHNASAVLVRFALDCGACHDTPPAVLDYVVHAAKSAERGRPVCQLALSAESTAAKRRAILCHATQLRLKRRFLVDFAGDCETFFVPGEVLVNDDSHPIRAAIFGSDGFHAEIRRERRIGIGPQAMLIAAEWPGGRTRVSMNLRWRTGRLEAWDTLRREPIARASIRVDGSILRVAVPLRLGPGAHSFVKLERPAERRMGLFDRAGWRPVPSAATAPRTSAAVSAVEQFSAR